MISELIFNKQKAIKADAPRSINTSGAYVGTIAQCEIYETEKGANMIRFAFMSQDGSLTFVPMCITGTDGTETFSMGILQAMMGILGVEKLQPVAGKVKARNGELFDGHRVPALEKKQIGMLLQRVNDVYNEKESYQMQCVSVFAPVSRQTYHEMAEGKEAQAIDKRLANLHDKDSKRLQDWRASGQKQVDASYASAAAPTIDDMSEDVPF